MTLKYDILAILSDRDVYDTVTIKNCLVVADKNYRYITLKDVAKKLRIMEKNGDVKIVTKTRYNRWGRAQPGRKLINCQITYHGLKKVEYLYKTGRIRKQMITALG